MRSEPRPQVQWSSAMVLTCGRSATRRRALGRALSCFICDRSMVGSVRGFRFYNQLKNLSGEVLQVGYKKRNYDSPGSGLVRRGARGWGPAGRRGCYVTVRPLAKSACQVRDSPPALCLPDVMDVAWSPHDAWLASCSVDNTVVIWNAVKFPGQGCLRLGGGRNGLLIIGAPCPCPEWVGSVSFGCWQHVSHSGQGLVSCQ